MTCVICLRHSDDSKLFEKHHLFPGKHRRTKVERQDDTILVCRDCGDQIHLMFDNGTLRTELDSLDALKEKMQSFIKWVQARPIEQKVNMKMKKRKL